MEAIPVRLEFEKVRPEDWRARITEGEFPRKKIAELEFRREFILENSIEIWWYDISREPILPTHVSYQQPLGDPKPKKKIQLPRFDAPIQHMKTPPRYNRIIQIATEETDDGMFVLGYNYREHYLAVGWDNEVHGGDPNDNHDRWLDDLEEL